MNTSSSLLVLSVTVSIAIAEPGQPLATVLTPDGAVMEGVSGSFDPSGFRMTFGSDGEPLFVEEGSRTSDADPFPGGSDSEGTWYPLGSGIDGGQVNAIAVSGSDVYAGGSFAWAGGVPASDIARWDGSSWSALGSGVGGAGSPVIYAVAISGSNVYVGGWFTMVGGVPANSIARWDGSTWSILGSGVSGDPSTIWAVAASGSNVYVGGWFYQAGGVSANCVARWNGSSWHPLGSGVNDGVVSAIAVSGSNVYVGGWFTLAGGVSANCIARWNGSSWSALGSGLNDQVLAIDVSDTGVLYVGGQFTQAGGIPANYIASWNGTSWSTLGSGVSGVSSPRVSAIEVCGSDVYVGGWFTLAGGIPASCIACWDGSSWSCPGSGVSGIPCWVGAIAAGGSDVYVGGAFTEAGEVSASCIARWVEDVGTESPAWEVITNDPQLLSASPNPLTSGTSLSFQSTGGSPLTISIHDISGRILRERYLGTLPSGSHTSYWDGRDESGSPLAPGVYLVRLSSDDFQACTRVVLMR